MNWKIVCYDVYADVYAECFSIHEHTRFWREKVGALRM